MCRMISTKALLKSIKLRLCDWMVVVLNKLNLESIKDLQLELRLLKGYISREQEIIDNLKSEYKYDSDTNGLDTNQIELRSKYINTLTANCQTIHKELEEMHQFINSIQDEYIKKIVIMRNVKSMSFIRISVELGGVNFPDSVRMIYNRFLKHEGVC